MTAELGGCNGVVEGCRVECEEVEVHAIPKPVLNEENLKLNEDKMGVNGGGSESCADDDEILPGSAQCEAELSNNLVDVGDHAPEVPVEDDVLESRDEGHGPECLLSDNKEVDDGLVENGETDCQSRVSVDQHPEIELHDSVNKPKKKFEGLVNGDDVVENDLVGNKVELPCLVNGDDKVQGDFVEDRLELPCLVNGEERVEREIVGDKLESPRLVNGEERGERDFVGDKLESPCFVDGEDKAERNFTVNNELEHRSHLVAEVQEIDSPELVIGNDEKPEQYSWNEQNQANEAEFECLADENYKFESQSISTEGQNLELLTSEDGAERNFTGNNELEHRSHLVAEVQEIDSPELVIGNDEKPEQCSWNEQNQANEAEFECLADDNYKFESQSISTEGQNVELLTSEDGAERNFTANDELEHRSHLVAEVQEIDSPELVIGNDEKPEQCSWNEQNQANEAEFECLADEDYKFESQSISTEVQNLELLTSVVSCELEETQSVVSQNNKLEENCESQSQNLENEDDARGHVIDEGKQPDPLFVLNADKEPESEKSIEIESHIVVTENHEIGMECLPDQNSELEAQFDTTVDQELESHIDVTENHEIEMECLPDQNSELEAQFDAAVDKELESGCFVDESKGVLTEDMDGQQVEEVHLGKDEISGLKSSDCNGTNIGGYSDTLDKNSGGYNGTVHADMQEDVAVSAAAWVSTGLLVGSNGLFTPISGNEQKPEAEVPKKLFYCLVKIPRHVDSKIKAQIRLAQLQLDEKTQSRDFIRAAVHMKRASREQMIERLKAAKQEERALRDAIRSKRQEMEPVQLTLNRMKNATSVEEFDEKIYQMHYRMEHESMDLREEKQLLRDIKQLKLSRDQLCAIAGPHSELQEAFMHIDKIQERSKLLGQELDSLRKQAVQAEKNVQAIEKEFDVLSFDFRQLQDQWNAADAVRQEAYETLKALKKQEYERNNEFYQNRGDIQKAKQYSFEGDREALDKLCSNQVERIMDIWNKSVEFRKEYVKDNERSILKRLETLDGRSLGPEEEPPLPTNYSDDLYPSQLPQGKPSASGIRSTPAAQPQTIAQQSNQIESEANGQQNSSNEVVVPQKKATGKSKKSQPESSRLIPEIESFEVSPMPVKVKEEDLAKKEKEAAKIKERIRQEEMRKAKEAEERKRRQTERANAKALARAQKEAERKEKEKQKKANKKAAAAASATNTAGNDTTLSSDKVESGASHDFKSSPVELKEATSETQKPASSQRKKSVSQKVKPKSVFPAAKKGRKGLQTWMWVLLAVCFCLAVMILWFYF